MPSGPGRLRIGRPLGIPIDLHLSWPILFALIVWTLATGYFPAREPHLATVDHWGQSVVAAILLFASIVLHEMGHALVARRSGIEIHSITLFVFGGVARLAKDPEDGRTELKMALAGPLVSVLLAGLFGLASTWPLLGPWTRAVAAYLALVNAGLALFNMVPAFPLDGGRVLRALLWPWTGKARATRIAAASGTLFAFSLMVTGVLALLRGAGIAGAWYVLIGWFLKEACEGAYGQVRLDEQLRGVTARDAMIVRPETLPAEISVAEAAHDGFLRTGYGAYPVVRGEVVVGLLCLRDVLKIPVADRDGVAVQSAMRPVGPAIVVPADEPLATALGRILRSETGRLLVMEGERCVGLLTAGSALRHARVHEALAA